MKPTIEELHARIMQIEQYLMDKEEYTSDVPWFNTDLVNYIEGKWRIVK